MKVENVYRVLDANLNRLREGIRVVEEFYRFVKCNKERAKELKLLRHMIRDIDDGINTKNLLEARDSENDPFSFGQIAKESERENLNELLSANIRRAQEAARVLEEYLKVIDGLTPLSYIAKRIRFALYTIEKKQVVDG